MPIQLVSHPLARHLVTALRDVNTLPPAFRPHARRLTTLIALEATADLPLEPVTVRTPMEAITGTQLGRGLVVVPILRAGLAMLEPFLELYPDVTVGYVGLERNHATAVASTYYCKLPPLASRTVMVVDPMLATGGSAVQAIEVVKAAGGTDIRLLCIVAAPEGVATVEAAHPDVRIFGAALDRELNAQRYILPGLGDFGDRLFGTM